MERYIALLARPDSSLRVTAVLALTVGAAACATNPATGAREFSLMSEAQEIQTGQQLDPEVRREMGVYNDPALQRYVEDVGLRLARGSERPNLPWHFTVVDQPAVNAFALPGGYIYITRGILPFLADEAQLAGVLGHEVGHVTARHAAQQYTKATSTGIGLTLLSIFVPSTRPFGSLAETAAGVLFLKYGRDDELQADRLGVRYASRASWDPRGIPEMLTTLERLDEANGTRRGVPNWLATHPQPADRVEKVRAALQEIEKTAGEASSVRNRPEFLRRLDGLVYGDHPDQGILRGDTFLHAALRFALIFPHDWQVDNAPQYVVAKAPDADWYLLLQTVPQARGTVEDVARTVMSNAGFRQIDGGRQRVNGLDAFVGTYQGTLQNLGRTTTRAAFIAHEQNVYMILGLAPSGAFARAEALFTRSIQSFRPLSRADAENIRPNRVDLYVVRAGDTWESIAARAGGLVKPSTLAIMNGSPVNQPPRPGEQIKIVVSG